MERDRLFDLKKKAGLPPERRGSQSLKKDGTDVELDNLGPATGGGGGGGSGEALSATNLTIAAHMKSYDSIKEHLLTIRKNVAQIHKLQDEETTTVNENARKAIMKRLDTIMGETTQAGSKIKSKLDEIKQENDVYKKKEPASATTQMRINLYQTHLRRFHQTMNSYNQAAHNFKKALRDRTRRELAIVDKNLSTEQIEKIVDEGKANEYVREALISEDLENVVAEIEERHKGIVKLEAQVLEVYELFRDLATLVELQQESLDVIENRVTMAKDYAGKAHQELIGAEDQQKKARKKACIIFFCVMIIVVAVVVPLSGGLGGS